MTLICSLTTAEFVVDRLADSVAVVEVADRRMVDVPLPVLPIDVQEGSRFVICLVPNPLSPAREAQLRAKDEWSFTPSQPRSLRVH